MLSKGPNPRVKIFSKSFQIKNSEKLINCYARADSTKLGSGGFGQIFRIIDKKSKKQDQYKCLKKVSQRDRLQAISEINALKSLSHPNILKFYEYFESYSDIFMVIEYVEGVDLIDFIQSGKTLSEKTAVKIMRQLLQALAYTHENKFIHRDIKCDNIMIALPISDNKQNSELIKDPNNPQISEPSNNADNIEKEGFIQHAASTASSSSILSDLKDEEKEIEVKLIDWGFSYNLKALNKDYIESRQLFGTYSYVSPEQIKTEKYNEKCDIWSAGVVMYCLLTKCFPFTSDLKFQDRFLEYQQESLSQFQKKLKEVTEENANGENNENPSSEKVQMSNALLNAKKRFKKEQQDDLFNVILFSEPKYDEGVQSPEAIDLMKKMLMKNPNERLSAVECLNHPWFQKSQSHQVDPNKIKENLKKMKNFTYSNEFQLAVWTYISSHLVENKEKKDLQDIFKRLDKDSNGVLSKEEIRQALLENELSADDTDIDTLFDAIDTDKSGQIDYNEFLASTLDLNLFAEKEHLQRVFSLIDLDKNGSISFHELKNILGSPDQRAQPEFQSIFEEIFSQIDVNNDGEISFEEFERLITSSQMSQNAQVIQSQ